MGISIGKLDYLVPGGSSPRPRLESTLRKALSKIDFFRNVTALKATSGLPQSIEGQRKFESETTSCATMGVWGISPPTCGLFGHPSCHALSPSLLSWLLPSSLMDMVNGVLFRHLSVHELDDLSIALFCDKEPPFLCILP
jgi:hypothetical protein